MAPNPLLVTTAELPLLVPLAFLILGGLGVTYVSPGGLRMEANSGPRDACYRVRVVLNRSAYWRVSWM